MQAHETEQKTPTRKILIDTDPGQDIDDLLAVWFALKRPELDIRAITTVTYPADKRARIMKRLLRYVDRGDVPVAAGMAYPLRVMPETQWGFLHDEAESLNHYAFAEPEDPRDAPGDADAVDLIIRTVEAEPGEVTLACIGPLTNIACALRRRPGLAEKIPEIAMMGGETSLNQAEHNVAFDPVAAELVLAAGIPLTMGTLDVTRRLVLSDEDIARFRSAADPVARAAAEAIDLWHPRQSWKPGPILYDVFPFVWAFDRSLYTVEPMSVQVETGGARTAGMTVHGGARDYIRVTTDLNAEALHALYMQTVLEQA
ncbi:MAG: nucleoside hydrolase [Lentisphaerae bacterium]|nr:nucleoside hydrolase [Lentisphaerota bacterium]